MILRAGTYSIGRGQEALYLLAWVTRPHIEKKKSQKRAGEVAQGVDPEFKSQY
jgi:hypothetical protein